MKRKFKSIVKIKEIFFFVRNLSLDEKFFDYLLSIQTQSNQSSQRVNIEPRLTSKTVAVKKIKTHEDFSR